MKTWKYAAVVVVAIMWLGDRGYKEDMDEQASFCEGVRAGRWPDYKSWCEPDPNPDTKFATSRAGH